MCSSIDADCICEGGAARTCPMEPTRRNLAFARSVTCFDAADAFGVTSLLRKVGAHMCARMERGRRPCQRGFLRITVTRKTLL